MPVCGCVSLCLSTRADVCKHDGRSLPGGAVSATSPLPAPVCAFVRSLRPRRRARPPHTLSTAGASGLRAPLPVLALDKEPLLGPRESPTGSQSPPAGPRGLPSPALPTPAWLPIPPLTIPPTALLRGRGALCPPQQPTGLQGSRRHPAPRWGMRVPLWRGCPCLPASPGQSPPHGPPALLPPTLPTCTPGVQPHKKGLKTTAEWHVGPPLRGDAHRPPLPSGRPSPASLPGSTLNFP